MGYLFDDLLTVISDRIPISFYSSVALRVYGSESFIPLQKHEEMDNRKSGRLLRYTPNREAVEAIVVTDGIDGRRTEAQLVHIVTGTVPRRKPVAAADALIARSPAAEVASERKL